MTGNQRLGQVGHTIAQQCVDWDLVPSGILSTLATVSNIPDLLWRIPGCRGLSEMEMMDWPG
jgi:hypothetical protein